uniref:Pentatricopeptide repeat-containing protein n=1 Tax=Ananas comosus var. bracteatus TaxID=296719 RepID=A0A6V7QCA7_ANACO|nr:unnamed protein product [Ananas comosus var. bracteatus]
MSKHYLFQKAFLHKKSTYFGFLQNWTTFFVFADLVDFFSKVTKIPLLSFLFPLFVSFVRFFFFSPAPRRPALRLASSLRFPPSRPLSLLILDSLCDRRLVADAESLFLRPPSPLLPSPFPPDTKVYNLLLRGWLKVRRWRRCRELWLDMDRNRVPKDLHSYSVYMDALSKSGKPWSAVRLFKEMSRKFAPDAVAYNTAIHALGSLSTPSCPPAAAAGEALVARRAAAARGRVSGGAGTRGGGGRARGRLRLLLLLLHARPPRHEASDEVESRVHGVGSGAREPGAVAPAEDRVPDSDVGDEEGRGGGGGGEVEGVGEARRGEGEVEARVDAAPLAIGRRRHSVTTDESRTSTLAPDLRRLCSFGGRRPHC